ncbi:MAG: alanine--glyoxylate aminotransferase family protein [Gemmatimonadota bacterium]
MTDKAFGTFFLPGPTEVHPDVLQAMTRPMIGHRVAEMEELIGHIQPRLQSIFRTTRPVYISASSATGLMEGAVRNGALRRVLCLVNGAFSERFFQITLATGLHAESLAVEWGQVHTPAMLESALASGSFDAVTVVHSETSTGALNPIRELAEVTHAAGDVVLLVDSVSGAAGADVRTDEWALDFILTGSQKSFALPPGLAFGVAQPHILERAMQKNDRGIYFDFLEFERNILTNQTPNTPAVSLLYALKAQVDRIAADGIDNRIERHRAMAERLWQWCDEKGLEILADAPHRAPTVTAIKSPAGWTGPKLAAAVKQQGYSIATGYGRMKDETIRIGHMGDHTLDGLNGLLEVLGRVLAR